MQQLRDAIALAIKSLREVNATFALVGGLAVSAWCEPRTTRDVDVAIAVDSDDDAERTVFALQRKSFQVLKTVEQIGTARLATARLRPPGAPEGGALLDLLFASSGIENEIASEAVNLQLLADVFVPVAQVGHLIALKLLSRDDESRPQDRIDLTALVSEATPADFQLARRAVSLIEERGFARGRDLRAALSELVSSGQGHI